MALIHGIPFRQCIFLTLYALTFLSLFCSKTKTISRPTNFKSLFSLLFCSTIIVGPVIRTTFYTDYENLLQEIYLGKKLLFPYLNALLRFFIDNLSSYDFILIVGLASGMILLFSIHIFSNQFTFSKINLSLLLFSVIPLQAFHFTQYTSFCLFSLSLVLFLYAIYNSAQISKTKFYFFLSFLLYFCSLLAHPLYLAPCIVVLTAFGSQCKAIHFITRSIPNSYLSLKLRTSKFQIGLGFLSVLLLLVFITSLFARTVYTYILSKIPAYSIYSNWTTQEGLSLIPASMKLLLIYMPFIIYSVFLIKSKTSRDSFALNFDSNSPFIIFCRNTISFSLLFSVAVLLTSVLFNFYSLQRAQSAFYPLLIFSPFISICRSRDTFRLFNPKVIDKIYLLFCFLASINRILSYAYSV